MEQEKTAVFHRLELLFLLQMNWRDSQVSLSFKILINTSPLSRDPNILTMFPIKAVLVFKPLPSFRRQFSINTPQI